MVKNKKIIHEKQDCDGYEMALKKLHSEPHRFCLASMIFFHLKQMLLSFIL